MKRQFTIITCLAVFTTGALAQTYRGTTRYVPVKEPRVKTMSGFRVGGSFISPLKSEAGNDLEELLEYNNIPQFVTQFGWQLERHFMTDGKRNGAVSEFVLMAGGLEQGVAIPSVTWLMGYRLDNGFEFGGGPNITAIKNLGGDIEVIPAFVWGTGYAVKAGNMYFPVNVAVTKNRSSMRTTMLVGYVFN